MRSIWDRLMLTMLAVIMNRLLFHWDKIVVYVLIAMLLFAVSSFMEGMAVNLIEIIIYLGAVTAGFAYTHILPFLAILLYSIILKTYEDKKYVTAVCVVAVAMVLRYGSVYGTWHGFIIAGFYAVALVLGIRDYQLTVCQRELKKVRDNATELTNTYKERNRYLVENQEKEVRIAMLSERNRIAREIHDNVGHMLSRSILQLGAIMAIHKDEAVYEQLNNLKETLNLAMNSIRESVHDLHKESFDVKQASESILEGLQPREVSLICDISEQADKEIKYAFVTILKEAVTNIQKHSNADKVKVTMCELQDYYQMLIEDNGTVNEGTDHAKSGIGIKNMEERIYGLGGVCSISTETGFRIFISVPKAQEEKE